MSFVKRKTVPQDLDPALNVIEKKEVRVSLIPASHLLLAAVHHLGNVIVTAFLVSTRRDESHLVTASVIVLVAVTHRVTVRVHRVTTVIILLAARNLNGPGLCPSRNPLRCRFRPRKASRILESRDMRTKAF